MEALRAAGARRVGIVLNFAPAYGEDPEAVDVADRYHNRFFLDPILGKGYPESPFRDPRPSPSSPATWSSWQGPWTSWG